MTTHSSILAWRIPMEGGAWRATVHRVEKSQTELKRHSMHSSKSIYRTFFFPPSPFLDFLLEKLGHLFRTISWKLCFCWFYLYVVILSVSHILYLLCTCVRRRSVMSWLFVTPWTVACEAPLSMGFSRQEYWSRLPFPSPGDLPSPGINPGFPAGNRTWSDWGLIFSKNTL